MPPDEREHHRHPRRPRLDPDQLAEEIERVDREREEAVKQREHDYARQIDRMKGDQPHQTAWLLIRYGPTDLGIRPLPPGTVFWASPDIWVESSDPLGNPVAGEPCYLHVRIFNLGALDAAPVKVDFYWADPALGLGPANMNLIGTEYVAVPSLTSVDVRCTTPWVPVLVNGGHECVMVNCSNWVLDPIIAPFQPTLDRHVGQRNLHVVEAAAGKAIPFRLQLTNVFPVEMPALVVAHFELLEWRPGEGALAPHERGGVAAGWEPTTRDAALETAAAYPHGSPAHRAAQRALAVARRRAEGEEPLRPARDAAFTRGAPSVRARLTDEVGALPPARSGEYAGRQLVALDAFGGVARRDRRGVVLQETTLPPSSFRVLEVEVTVPPGLDPGQVLLVHLTHEAGPLTMGGYTVVVDVQ